MGSLGHHGKYMADSAAVQGMNSATVSSEVKMAPLAGASNSLSMSKVPRVAALDFTKGALVLIMVLYHWLNYFVTADGDVYKYIRFLTPSFIFISGFLISQVYLSTKIPPRHDLRSRLLVRGLKLLTLVAVLNIALFTVQGVGSRVQALSPSDAVAAFFLGTNPVAFSVLVPIAYLLILAAILAPVFRRNVNTFHITSALFVACALVLSFLNISNSYMEIFSIGTLGISIGHWPMERINHIVKRPITMIVAYILYLVAITIWNVIYPLQIAGVCLSVSLIYLIGLAYSESNSVGKTIVLLGQYSLFGYIAQIIILQVLRRAAHLVDGGITVTIAAFVMCLVATIVSVMLLDKSRRIVRPVNTVYKAVFG
ncbi:MAG TPA: acyltransferase [Terriglobales bacterium]|nr:acyltransferase [Terriglobales bacterium]